MHISKINAFLLGLFLGGILTALLKYGYEIVFTAVLGFITWTLKKDYEAWLAEKRSIAQLQRVTAYNHNTLIVAREIFKAWSDSFNRDELYYNYFEKLQEISDENLDSLRSLDLLNNLMRIKIITKRYNIATKKLWRKYSEYAEVIQRDPEKDHSYTKRNLKT